MNVALVAPAATIILEGTLAAPVLLLESATSAPPAGAGPLRVTVPVEFCVPPTTVVGLSVKEESETAVVEPGAGSKSQMDGFESFMGTITNFDGEITYATALPPAPELILAVPLPFVGEADMEYVALNVAPETGPLGSPISSTPLILPVELAPSAVNSPEKTVTPKSAGVLAIPP